MCIRDRLAVVLPRVRRERRNCAESAGRLALFLNWPVLGVTLADDQMVSQSTYQHDVHRSSNPMHSATQSRTFWLSPDTQQASPKKRVIAPLFGGGSA